MDRAELARTLKRIPVFRCLRTGDVERLAEKATVRSYGSGAVVVHQDDTAVSLYCVVSGRVRVVRETGKRDEQIILAELGPGGFFGEMALLDDNPRSATVVTLEPTQCALISKWDFTSELKNHPEVGLALLRVLSQRIRQLDERLML